MKDQQSTGYHLFRVPKNLNELSEDLAAEFAALRQEPKRVKQALVLSHLATTIIKATEIQVNVAIAMRQEPTVPFLPATSGIPMKRITQNKP